MKSFHLCRRTNNGTTSPLWTNSVHGHSGKIRTTRERRILKVDQTRLFGAFSFVRHGTNPTFCFATIYPVSSGWSSYALPHSSRTITRAHTRGPGSRHADHRGDQGV